MVVTKITSFFRGIDWLLIGSVFFLVLIGLQAIYSLSLGDVGLTRFDKQLVAIFFGIILFLFGYFIDYRKLGSLSWFLYGTSITGLLLVLFLGTTFGGTTGWFVLGNFSFQPVEFIKIFSVIIMAYHMNRRVVVNGPRLWLESLLILLPIVLLLAMQPDFGPIFLLLLLWFILNAVRGLSKNQWFILFGMVIIVAVIGWFGVLSEVHQGRITNFLNPSADPTGGGFQVNQSIIAVGSGGIVGRGIGEGFQSQLNFLPAAATDFIFASILEERGFVGFLIILLLFTIFYWRILRILNKVRDPYSQYLVLGLGLLLLVQTLLNIAMNIGLAPVVGLSLPFLSYGGSALIAEFFLVGILMNVVVRQKF